MIPDAAVEAAAKVQCESHHWVSTNVPGLLIRWVIQCSICEAYNVEEMNAALEAAAPHMLAAAWDEGHQAGWGDRDDDAQSGWVPSGYAVDTPNPYRSRA